MTREDVRDDVQERLGDTAEAIWTETELNTYVQQGYDRLAMDTGILWDTAYFPDYAAAFSYTQTWEADYAEVSGWRISGVAQFTSLADRNYVDNGQGPANHSFPWEFNGGYLLSTIVSALVDLPTDLYEIERATWNDKRIDPLRSRELEGRDSRYELNGGLVEGYLQDKDGLRRLRKWRVPSTGYAGYTYDNPVRAFDCTAGFELGHFTTASGPAEFTVEFEAAFLPTTAEGPANFNYAWEDTGDYVTVPTRQASSDFGMLRTIDDVYDGTPLGSFGDLASIPGVEKTDTWGVIRVIYRPESNLKLEYRRRGAALSDDDIAFEIPDRYVKYIRWFVLAQALGRDGDGQDMELSTHYQQRFEAGIARIQRRRLAVQSQRKVVMGGNGSRPVQRNPRVRLPWQYGQVVR